MFKTSSKRRESHKKWYRKHRSHALKYKKDYYRTHKKEELEYNNKYTKLNPWVKTLRSIYSRCNQIKNESFSRYGAIGIKSYLTIKDLKYLWFRDKAHKMKKPSIHRKNSKKDYTKDNCKFLELNLHMKLNK